MEPRYASHIRMEMSLSEALREIENGEKSLECRFNSFAGLLLQNNSLLAPKVGRFICLMKMEIYSIR